MNGQLFQTWVEQLIPALDKINTKVVVIMDKRSVPLHGVANKKKNIAYDESMTKKNIWNIIKPHLDAAKITRRYVIDEILAKKGHDVLRLPPYHCQYNPIEMKNSNRNVAADKGFLHEGQRPYASADNFSTLLDRRHPPGPLRRAGPHTGLSLAEEPESRGNSYLARECCGEEGPRGLSEDTDGVINQRRKKDSEELPPARSPKDSYWISSPRPGAPHFRSPYLTKVTNQLGTTR
ncbi:hypothetical protein GEV33_006991 [Tenebrio molitor]|uniref:Uncharacterized protein n=1 Tax=Tenebrio molitor TaxID=7067 RepID=A0A8J6HBJ8_TENMO|nr:hypothetical protein GEV33_006991 [Tenebrio molitor]